MSEPLSQEAVTQAIAIKLGRDNASKFDLPKLYNDRTGFLDKLSIWNWNPSIKTLEMYPTNNEEGIVKSPEWVYQYIPKFHNTRTKLMTETCCEFDKVGIEQARELICETALSLIRAKVQFAIFYAEGQRSPHIRIYDWVELRELTPFQRIKAQVAFWRKHIPFGCFQYIDTGIFQDEHYLCLEFAPHWKYGSIFNLFNANDIYISRGKKC